MQNSLGDINVGFQPSHQIETVPSEAPVSAGYAKTSFTNTNNTDLERSLSFSSMATEPTFDPNDLLSGDFSLDTPPGLRFNNPFVPLKETAGIVSAGPQDEEFSFSILDNDLSTFDDATGFVDPSKLMNSADESTIGDAFDEMLAMATLSN
jgi:hypothetical protein